MVERRPLDVLSAFANDFLPSLDFFELSFELGAGEDCDDFGIRIGI